MKRLAIALSAAAVLGACAPNAPTAVVDPSSPLAAPMYMQMAASSDLFEIQSSQLALQMSQNPGVRSMAQMLIADHTRMSGEMMAAARSAGLPPPPQTLMPEDAAMLDRIRMAPPGTFDMTFRDLQVTAHQKALALHSNYASGGDRPALRAVASRAVPVIQGHLNHAQSLQVSMMQPPMQAPMAPAPAYSAPAQPGERG